VRESNSDDRYFHWTSLDALDEGADNFTFGGPVCIVQLRLQVSRKFGKTAHHRAQVCPPFFIGRFEANLRIDIGYPSLCPAHASRELGL